MGTHPIFESVFDCLTWKVKPIEIREKMESMKLILCGDSAVGKSKLVERFLLDDYSKHTSSTYAITKYIQNIKIDGLGTVKVDLWDTAGQERFMSLHPGFYHNAHAAILVFDVTRKSTYKNLSVWYKELRQYRSQIPVIVLANKIDENPKATEMQFNFAKKNNLEMNYSSAADGTNVVKVFHRAIEQGVEYKSDDSKHDFNDLIAAELEEWDESDEE